VFEPYDPTLTAAQRQMQLNSVVTNGNGQSTFGADAASTSVLFANLFSWKVTTAGASEDCYESVPKRERVTFGSVVLNPGAHTFRFEVIGKNLSSAGRKIGVDALYVSPSYGPREGEAQLPPLTQVGVAAQRDYMAGGSWSGNYQLGFPATADGQYFELSLENDRWEETNFDGDGAQLSDTAVVFNQDLIPMDFVVKLDGPGTNWSAAAQAADTNLAGRASSLSDCVVRIPLRGDEMVAGGWIGSSGRRSKFAFTAGAGSFDIDAAFVAESASSLTNTPDTVSGATRRVMFGGNDSRSIPAGTTAWSDLIDFPVSKAKSYLLSFVVRPGFGHGNTVGWNQEGTVPGCYIVPSPVDGEAIAALPDWSSRSDVTVTNAILGLTMGYATCPAEGSYVSQVYDTQVVSPQYQTIGWNSSEPSGTGISMFIRTANSNDMSDALAWTNLSAVSKGGINPGAKRYVQFRSVLTSNSDGTSTPLLKDVLVRWTGPQRGVDVGATLTKGPDHGIVRMTVDGKPLTSALQVEITIFKEARGFRGAQLMTSALRQEITPRNTR
jgi:hypothetical protein